MASLQQIEKDINEIKSRNKMVEADKAWETSYTRRGLLTLFTFFAVGLYLTAMNISNPWLNAIVAAFAFMLSTLTFPFFKAVWV